MSGLIVTKRPQPSAAIEAVNLWSPPDQGILSNRWFSLGAANDNESDRVVFTSSEGHVLRYNEADKWPVYTKLGPAEAVSILTRDIPCRTNIDLFVDKNERDSRNVNILFYGNNFSDRREIDWPLKVIRPGNIEVHPQFRYTGIGRHVLRNEIEFFHACGIRRMEITAACEAGGYTWARFGFAPDNVNSPGFDKRARSLVGLRYNFLEHLLTLEEKQALAPHINLRKPSDLAALADMAIDIGPRLACMFTDISMTFHRQGHEKLKQAEKVFRPHNYNEQGGNSLVKSFQARAREGQRISIGQALLSGTYWAGHLDFNNADQMRRVSAYTGGFKYIKIEGP